MAMTAVSTVAPAISDKDLTASHRVILQCRRNSTEKNPIPEKDRSRWIVIPELSVPSVPSAFTSIVLDTLYKVARDQFDALWAETPQLSELDESLFTVDSLLLYWGKKAESARLNINGIQAWFDASTLRTRIMKMDEAKRPASIKKYSTDGFCKLAAPLIDFSEQECSQLLDLLNKEENQDHTILRQMAARLRNRIASLQQQRQMAFADDLPE